MKSEATRAKLLRLGRLFMHARALEQKARAARARVNAYTNGGFYTSTSLSEPSGELTVSVKLPLYLELFPAAKPTLMVFEAVPDLRPAAYARLHYPAQTLGDYAPGKRLRIDAWSEPFDPPQPQSSPSA